MTASEIDRNITFNLFDYWQVSRDAKTPLEMNKGINAGHILKFSQQTNTPDGDINKMTNDGKTYQGIVKNTLKDGYPVVDRNNESLAYLFNPAVKNTYRKDFTNCKTSSILSVGTGETTAFNSRETWAKLNESTKTFTLTKQAKANFFPFDNPNADVLANYKTFNHFFGVELSMKFGQPAGGILPSTKGASTFSFYGDDDIWVFIDDVLVLDVGGIHGQLGGVINFATGEITYNFESRGTITFPNRKDTIKNAYTRAGKASSTTWRGNTYADNTVHTLKMFYLERGYYNSNCVLNISMLPMNYNVNAQASTGGTITNPGDSAATFASSKTYTVSANKYYKIKDVYYAKAKTPNVTTKVKPTNDKSATVSLNTITDDYIVRANFEKIRTSVIYDANAPDAADTTPATVHDAGTSAFVSPCGFARKGYQFAGWNTDPNGNGTSYSPDDVLFIEESDIILYAQWDHYRHVKWIDDTTGQLVAEEDVIIGESATAPHHPPRHKGRVFTGFDHMRWKCVEEDMEVRLLYAPYIYKIPYDTDSIVNQCKFSYDRPLFIVATFICENGTFADGSTQLSVPIYTHRKDDGTFSAHLTQEILPVGMTPKEGYGSGSWQSNDAIALDAGSTESIELLSGTTFVYRFIPSSIVPPDPNILPIIPDVD